MLPGTVRGLVLPSGKYLNSFAEYLNHILPLARDFSKFKSEVLACQVAASDELIREAMQAMNLYKLRHFAALLFQIMNDNDQFVKEAIARAVQPATGAPLFYPVEKMQHYNGLKLII